MEQNKFMYNVADTIFLRGRETGQQNTTKNRWEASAELFKWPHDNLMKSNADESLSLVSTNNTANIGVNFAIKSTYRKKLLEIKFDYKVTS